jgi:hypothetical protein
VSRAGISHFRLQRIVMPPPPIAACTNLGRGIPLVRLNAIEIISIKVVFVIATSIFTGIELGNCFVEFLISTSFLELQTYKSNRNC